MLNRILLAAFVALVPSLAFGQANWNDYATGATISRCLNTIGQNGEVATITAEDILIVKDGATVLTAGITVDDDVSLDFGGGAATKTGLHKITIVLTTSGYDDGDYEVIYKDGVVDTIGVQNRIAATFSIGRNASAPANFDSLSVDGDGRVDVIKIAGTTQTAGDIAANLATVDTVVDAIKVVTDLLNSAQAEPTGVPTANPTPLEKIGRLYKTLFRGRIVNTDPNEIQYLNAAGEVEWVKPTSDDNTAFTEGGGEAP